MTSVDVDILIAYSSKVIPGTLLLLADGHHIDSWGGTNNRTLTVENET